MAAEAAYNTTINITSQPAVGLTNEATTDLGAHTVYTISNSAKRYLDINTPVVVALQTAGTGSFNVVSASNYTLKQVGGSITFNSPNGATDVVRINSGSYYAYAQLGQAYSAEYGAKVQAINVTAFNSAGTENYIGGLLGGTLKCADWWLSTARTASIDARDLLVLSFQTASGRRFEGYVYASDSNIKSDVKNAVDENLTFQLNNQFYSN